MLCAINVSEELILSAFNDDAEIHSLPSGKLPRKINKIHDLENIVSEISGAFCNNCRNFSIKHVIDLITHFLDHLETIIPEIHSHIGFMKEQILLLPLPKTTARYL